MKLRKKNLHGRQAYSLWPSRLAGWFVIMGAFSIGCTQPPKLEYETYTPIVPNNIPVIVVGRILSQVDIGRPSPFRPDPSQPIQLRKVNVQVENVLRGEVSKNIVSVYYQISLRAGGRTPMGMFGHGGKWRVGDRLVWFLRSDSGMLRTVLDTWAETTVTVLSGPHLNYRPGPKESYADQVIDILLDLGEGCQLDQLALAILASTERSLSFDQAYTVAKLRQIASNPASEASIAALGELQQISCDLPPFYNAYTGLCNRPKNDKKVN